MNPPDSTNLPVHNLLQHGIHTSETEAMLYSSFAKLGRFKVLTDVSCSRGWSCESINKEIYENQFLALLFVRKQWRKIS